ncbi:hypothetical protein CAEBREN_20572 [Caenorhabditis brenneri]|uniref:T20D4.11-like domain-containing protein n=1 Tax=Caenorhabditis brenneri TaxID=135651 RepID=G0NN05_CAEBE|nr:hypothetical protein CAEBREN_20572 [Caenorhabditis brenneri]
MNRRKADLDAPCAAIAYAVPDNELCLRGFFRKAYMAQFSNEDSCFKEYSFLDSNLENRRNAFMNGKLCFVKYAREYCTTYTVDYFNSDKYRKLTETVSSEDYHAECKSPQSRLQFSICRALVDELTTRSEKMKIFEFRSNKNFVEQTKKIFRDTEACLSKSCASNKSKNLLREFAGKFQAWRIPEEED